MRRGLTTSLVALLAGLLAGPLMAVVEVGTARVNVLQELGRPDSAVARGDTETLTYKNGVKVKLQRGRVTEVTGQQPAAATPAGAPQEPAAKPAEEPDEPPEPVLTKEQQAALEKMEKEAAEADAKARAQMEKAIADLEGAHDLPPPGPSPFNPLAFLFELGFKWVLTLGALKLSCKYWNSEVEWKGLMLVAVVDVAIRGVIGFIGFKLLHMFSLFYADEAVSAFVMVLLLRKVSINQRLALAVEVVFTVKTFTIVVGSFLVTVMLRMMAG